LLQAKDFHVALVAVPLTSFAGDVAATKRATKCFNKPVVLMSMHQEDIASSKLLQRRIENSKLAVHWDAIQDNVTQTSSKNGAPMFGAPPPERNSNAIHHTCCTL